MAEFRARYDEIRGANADVAGISVDDAGHSEPVRGLYQITFPILCDPQAEIIHGWGLYDPHEKGGISRSAIFVIAPGMLVRYVTLDSTVSRVRADGVLEFLQDMAAGKDKPAPPLRRVIVPTVGELVRTALPALKLSLSAPKRR